MCVHTENLERRLGHGSIGEVGHNQVQSEPSLCHPVSAFDDITFTTVTVLCLPVSIRVFPRSAQSRPRKPDAMFFAIRKIITVSVNLIRLYSLGIKSMQLFVALDAFDQGDALVKIIETLFLDEGISVNHAECQLLTKLVFHTGFPTDNWPDMRLAQADDAVWYAVGIVLQHFPLLPHQLADRHKPGNPFFLQGAEAGLEQ